MSIGAAFMWLCLTVALVLLTVFLAVPFIQDILESDDDFPD